MHSGKGFIAALDQSGGSTPKALEQYGVSRKSYNNDEEMFDLVHAMRTRVITSEAFSSEHIIGAILFEGTMERQIEGIPTAEFLWKKKGIVPFLKIDKGMEAAEKGVQLMKPIDGLDALLEKANSFGIFGTKMRSFISEANADGIHQIVEQQFAYAKQIMKAGLVPIIEPEVDINSPEKLEAEALLLKALEKELLKTAPEARLIFKISLPSLTDFYVPLMADPRVVRIVALSGGYGRYEADTILTHNHGLIASFSRALLDGLSAKMKDAEFNKVLGETVKEIYTASIT
jgi:fructose-bisphosphate aldolase class I